MNHQAIVAVVTEVIEIENADKIHIAKVLGETCIVSKDVGVGHIGVLFPEGVQLSEEYCKYNNLYRDKSKNTNPEKAGFFEGTRRVRAQPFLKVRSTAYFANLDSLAYTNSSDFKLGYSFSEINGKEICRKYISKATQESLAKANRPKQAKIDYAPDFLKHVDSAQFKHAAGQIEKGSLLHFHAKVHGTSARMAHTKVAVELNGFQKLVNKLFGKEIFATTKYDFVVGTRNVVLHNTNKEGFHGLEQFRFDVMEQVKPFLVKGMTVYGEIAGFANNKPIMPSHSIKVLKDKAFMAKYGDEVIYRYGCGDYTKYRFHIYRITLTNGDGVTIDYTQKQIDDFCKSCQLLAPFEVHPPIVYDGNVRDLQDLVEKLTERPEVLTEDYIDPSHISEGIIVREDHGGLIPRFYKSKSYAFRAMEGICEVEDPEDAA